MRRIRISFILALVTLTVVATAPPVMGQSPRQGGTVHVVVQPEPPSLMLGLTQNSPTHLVAGNIYESLLRYDEKLQPQPSLAKSWEISSDAKIYTFKLQEGVKWHDGKPFTADDVVFSLDKFLRDVHPRWRTIVTQVEKIERADAGTVRIVLKQAFGPMILAMEVASAPMVPKHIYDGTDYRANPANNTPIGTGPFKLKEWKKGSYIHLVRNNDYWMKGKPHLDEIYWQVIPDAAARAVAYETGKIDVLPGGSVDAYDVARLAKLPNTCATTKGWEMFAPHAWLTPNIARGGVLANKQFRQGMMYAIDREFGKNVVWAGLGKIPTGPVSSKTKFYSADVRKYTYDPAKAKELIKASGYKGEPIKLLALPYGETWSRWAEAIKQNLIDAGVNVQTETTDVPGWTQKASNGEFDMTMNFLYQLGDPATGVARSYISTNIVKGNPFANQGAYMNPEVDRLFAQGASAPSDALRQDAYTKVQKLLAEELPVLWLLELDFSTIYRCNVKNLVTTAIGVNDGFRDAWKE